MSTDTREEYSDGLTRERSLTPKEEISELELKELVRRAQGFEQAAIDELYNRFRGMILSLINKESIRDAIGEDAENIAWEIFYDVIPKVNIHHGARIAGYLKKYISGELNKKVKAETCPWCVDSINEYEEDGYQVSDKDNNIESYLENIIIKGNIANVSKDTRTVLKKFYYEGYSLEDCAKAIGRSYTATYKLKQKGLDKLRKVIPVSDYAYN